MADDDIHPTADLHVAVHKSAIFIIRIGAANLTGTMHRVEPAPFL
jgi:hypothetical protein